MGFLEFAEVAIGGVQALIQAVGIQVRELEAAEFGLQLPSEGLGPFTAELAGLPILVKQGLELLEFPMEPGAAQGRGEVIDDHGLGAPFGLGALTGIVNDEGIEVGQGAKGPFGKTLAREAQGLSRQPFEVAVLAHMHHHLGAKRLAQPQVLGQIGVGGRQVGAVITEGGVPVVAPLRLD